MYIDSNGGNHEVALEEIEASKADPLCMLLAPVMVIRKLIVKKQSCVYA